jgi:16S rRNA (cytosine1402-N4)-methyltransferase
MTYVHTPVLLDEIVTLLDVKQGDVVVDCTVGGGGHARLLAERIGSNGTIIGIDRDHESILASGKALALSKATVDLHHGHYKDIKAILHEKGHGQVAAILFDLGYSSYHVDQSGRGFSFRTEEPLDMRYDVTGTDATAEHIINTFSEKQLTDLLWKYGEEKHSRVISERIVKQRTVKPIRTTADLIAAVVPDGLVKQKQKQIHPATRTFQALRIAVNEELRDLPASLGDAIDLLQPGGRIAVISFHSLEDRIVKRVFRDRTKDCICPPEIPECRCDTVPALRIITKKPVTASQEEITRNPRARSAKLRVAQKI